MQFDLPFLRSTPEPAVPETSPERIEFVRTPRARRYILRVKPDGTLRVTIPRRGSRVEAINFVGRHLAWITKERARVQRDQSPVRWSTGSTILLDGRSVTICVEQVGDKLFANYGGRSVRVSNEGDVRGPIERDLRALAAARLIPRLKEFAERLGVTFTRVTIRNQRSRWGSCSRRGAIALNLRLVQMPAEVADYVLIHELTHLTQQNHGPRFWALIGQACPAYRESERWLRTHGRSLF
ncbi:MAG: SprT family zinc-dependent metalloprotease [Vicinamibacterales bacterium]